MNDIFVHVQIPESAQDGEVQVNLNQPVYLHLKDTESLPKFREILYKSEVAEKPKKVQMKVCLLFSSHTLYL
jgi:hypothetical protein